MKKSFQLFLILSAILTAHFSFAQDQDPIHWKQSTVKISDCEYELVFSGTIDNHWHIFSLFQPDGDGPIASHFKLEPNPLYEAVGKPTESMPIKSHDKVFDVPIAYFEKSVVFKQKIKLKTDKPVVVKGQIDYQACTEELCIFPPANTFELKLQGTTNCIAKNNSGDTSKKECICDTAAILKSHAGIQNKTSDTGTSITPSHSETSGLIGGDDCNPWHTLFIGLGFGLGAVLMPCIYSLIPLTVSFFLKQSKSRVAAIKNSVLYGLFIILIFVGLTLGITIVFGPAALSNIASNTWLNLFFFALFVVFALSFFGLFEITLPSSWANKVDAKADRGGFLGIFFMALTLVIVSFSCTVGFMGSLLTAVSRGDSYICPLMGFTGFGTGIALPFMLFALFPSMLKSLPKSGGWMTTFKVSIAFLELALAVKFLANADNVNEWGFITREVFIALWIAIFGMLTFYLLGVFRTAYDDTKSHLSVARILWGTFFLSFTIYLIPGMWGAPLKLISAFPPPHYYAEAPNGFGGNSNHSSQQSNGNSEMTALENLRVVGPEGLLLFKDDYESALKYARMVKKPLFIDFTGKTCANCRLMESNVWVKPEVMKLLRDSVVIVSLYVDSKVDLPKNEQREVFWFGKNRTLRTLGDKWGYLQTTRYNVSAQPLYVVLNHDEAITSEGPMATELDEKKFESWLRNGINRFKK